MHNPASWLLTLVGRGFLFVAPVLAVLGGVLTWAYQVGSSRLGVVDLFACEISTLCRIAAAVDTVRRHVKSFEEGPTAKICSAAGDLAPRPFTSEENYFPVFEENSRDLEALEARVFIYITEFYTYMKAVRDMQRALAQIKPEAAGSGESTVSVDDWHEAVRNIVYMLYLGLESARYAICLLVEFEPEQMERTIVVLISELEAYRFLCSQFTGDDVRRQRILLRERDYRKLVPLLIEFVKYKANAEAREPPLGGAHWEPASVLLRELKKRYLLALPETAGQ